MAGSARLEVSHRGVNSDHSTCEVHVDDLLALGNVPRTNRCKRNDSRVGNGDVYATDGLGKLVEDRANSVEVGDVQLTVLDLDVGVLLGELLLEIVELVRAAGNEGEVVLSCLGKLVSEGKSNAS